MLLQYLQYQELNWDQCFQLQVGTIKAPSNTSNFNSVIMSEPHLHFQRVKVSEHTSFVQHVPPFPSHLFVDLFLSLVIPCTAVARTSDDTFLDLILQSMGQDVGLPPKQCKSQSLINFFVQTKNKLTACLSVHGFFFFSLIYSVHILFISLNH